MKNLKIYKLTLILALFFQLGCAHFIPSDDNCLKRRGAFDIGSGSTKAFAAVVDICQNKILTVLIDEQTPIGFKDSLNSSPLKLIGKDVINEAEVKLTTLARTMRSEKVTDIRAVATAAFREAENGESVAKLLSQSSHVKIDVISQEKEAELGVNSALVLINDPKASIWDIGGGSMQITLSRSEKELHFKGDLASVSFKNLVLKEFNIKGTSPNPLGSKWKKAVELARAHAEKNLSAELKSSAPQMTWVGVGGVWWHSLRNQVGEKNGVLLIHDIESTLKRRSQLKDSQIESSYRETEVTNLALVLGYMKAMNLSDVKPINASLVQGLLFD